MSMTSIPSLPMYFPDSSTGFKLADAQTCAALVGVAYQQFVVWSDNDCPSQIEFSSNTQWQGQVPSGWSGTAPQGFTYSAPIWSSFEAYFLTHNEPFGFVATDGSGNAYVVFRGTMTTADEYIDGEVDQSAFTVVSGFGNVQEGFLRVYLGLQQELLTAIDALDAVDTLYFTGHSMGSALSSLAAPDIVTNSNLVSSNTTIFYHYNFASPRVGDLTFAAATNAIGFPTFRIVNTEDLVPAAPPSVTGSILYQHVGYPVDFTAQYGSIDGNHSMADAYVYAIDNPKNPLNPNPASQENIVTAKGIGSGYLSRLLIIPASRAAVTKGSRE
jgi:triacylglycerol lipase